MFKLYVDPCVAARCRTLCISSVLIVFVLLCIWYDLNIYGFLVFCISVAFWLLVYVDKFLILSSRAAVGWVLFRLIFIPLIVVVMLFMNSYSAFFEWTAARFDIYFSSTLIGVSRTANSMFEYGFEEAAQEIKSYFFVSFSLLLFFGAELLVSALSIAGRIHHDGDLEYRISMGRKIPFYCIPLLIFFIFVPFVIDAYTPGCTGRRCGLESGWIGVYLGFSHLGIVLGFMSIAAVAWSRMAIAALMIKYGD
jgi:hypothetical protein